MVYEHNKELCICSRYSQKIEIILDRKGRKILRYQVATAESSHQPALGLREQKQEFTITKNYKLGGESCEAENQTSEENAQASVRGPLGLDLDF